MRTALFSMTLMMACSNKAATPASSQDAPPKVSLAGLEIPTDSKSEDFARRLLQTPLNNFSPTDAAGAKFVYTNLVFSTGNTWAAEAYVEFDEMQIECTESGTWSMTPAQSSTTAGISWTVAKTDCAGREAGGEVRALMTLGSKGLDSIKFR